MLKIYSVKNIIIILISITLISCKKDKLGYIAENGMVVSARIEASKIGVDILRKGGNAFDAMIATELALAVSYPSAGNIGGGGFMVFRKNNGEIGALDFREKAPLTADENMYIDENGNIIEKLSEEGALSCAVPGTIAGIFSVHERFGTLPISEIFRPVIELAENGIVITKKQSDRISEFHNDFVRINSNEIIYNRTLKENDTLVNINLASTLKKIMKNGKDEFYNGETAKIFVDFIQDKGGIISLEDMRNYNAVWREPHVFQYKNLNIISMPLPSSGGICLNQILKMIEPFDVGQYKHNSKEYVKILVEAQKRSFADRSNFLGDSDFVDVEIKKLVNNSYLEKRMQDFSFESPTNSSMIDFGDIYSNESEETTHYSIVDQYGNAVAVTTTLNSTFGSKLYCEELGFFINNEMDDFSIKPGYPNQFGLIGGEANKIIPEKRMLSSMTPTIVENDGKLYMVVGTPGGSTIITSVLQTILNIHDFGMGMQESVDAGRFHHQWLPDSIRVESSFFDKNILNDLEEFGYNYYDKGPIGRVDGILIKNNKLEGGADKRGDDAAYGF